MSASWLWRGNDDELELLSPNKGMSARYFPCTAARSGDALVVWTDDKQVDQVRYAGVWVLNPNSSAAARMTDRHREEMWKRAGLCGGAPLPSQRVYRVSVMHLEPVRIERVDLVNGFVQSDYVSGSLGGNGWTARGKQLVENKAVGTEAIWQGEFGSGQWPEDAALRRVARTAAAALYALGLDIGEAEVALGGDGRTSVRTAWPRLRDQKLAANELGRFAAWYAAACEEAKGRELLIGADPEFVFVTPAGKVAAASRFLGGGAAAAAGSDAMLVGRRLLYPVAELRPQPATGPAELAANVRRLLLGAASRTSGRRLRWAAGAMPVPGLALGGHIHLSGAPLTSRLLRLLDSCVAFPLALVEDPAGRERRPRYGTLGDYRQQPHGGFEYRTLPSWLISPLAAKAAFALVLLCAREAEALTYIPALEERYTAAYYAGDRSALSGCLEQIALAISATSSYEGLAPFIEPLFEAARRGDTWDERGDIRHKWRIPFD